MKKMKHVEDSLTEQTYLLMHRHINGYGRLFGGQLLMWIDELAGIVATRHSESRITTFFVVRFQHKDFRYKYTTDQRLWAKGWLHIFL